jgi:hypothetical protein
MPSPIRKCVLEMANIYSKSNKQNALDEVCAEFGLKYIRGSGFYSDRIEYISYETPQDKKSFSIILELLTKCHIMINMDNYNSLGLSIAHGVIKRLLPELGENDSQQLTNKILGLVTHREDGRWYKFESSLSSPPRHAALLIRFLQKETNQLKDSQIRLGTNIRLNSEERDRFLNLLDKFDTVQSSQKPNILYQTEQALSIYCEFDKYGYGFTSCQKQEIYKIINTVEKYSRDRNLGTLILTIKELDQTFNEAIDILDVNLLNYCLQKLANIFVITLLYISTSNNRYSHNEKIELAKICEKIFFTCFDLKNKINYKTWNLYGLVLQRIDIVSIEVQSSETRIHLEKIFGYKTFLDCFKKDYEYRSSENTGLAN